MSTQTHTHTHNNNNNNNKTYRVDVRSLDQSRLLLDDLAEVLCNLQPPLQSLLQVFLLLHLILKLTGQHVRKQTQRERQGKLCQRDDEEKREGDQTREIDAGLHEEVALATRDLLAGRDAFEDLGADADVGGEQFGTGPHVAHPVEQFATDVGGVRNSVTR